MRPLGQVHPEIATEESYADVVGLRGWVPIHQDIGEWLKRMESPIEEKLGKELACLIVGGQRPILCSDSQEFKAPARWSGNETRIELWPQRWLSNRAFRVDFHFLCRIAPRGIMSAVIECDGHEFHGTKEQVAKDLARDRALTALGHLVVRFSGTEIHKDAHRCAQEVRNILERKQTLAFIDAEA